MKLGSLFDGSGGFPLSGALCGIEPAWAAEVEPYPIAVTRNRFPNMRHLGDISKVSGADIEPVDIITFGSPCQDLSVAGLRKGLKHEANGDEETTRSGLFMEAVRIIKEMRAATNGVYPRFALWENVPGAFSSNKGEDFRIVCEELIKIVEPRASMPSVPQKGWPYSDSYCGDGWSLAYRVFDAQYWGVPQRRRRIHLVVDFRGECAGEVLFEREGVRGYFAEGRTPWQATPCNAQDCSGADDREGEATGGDGGRQLDAVASGVYSMKVIARNGKALEEQANPICASDYKDPDLVAYTLKVRSGCDVDSGGKAAGKGALVQVDKAATLATVQDQYLFQPMAYSFDSLASNSMKSSNPHSGCRAVEVAKTLDTTDPNPSKNQGGIAIVEPTAILDNIGGQAEYGKVTPVNGTLRSAAQGAVAFAVEPICMATQQGGAEIRTDNKAPTVTAAAGMSGNNQPVVALASGKDVTGCLMASGYEKLGAQEMFSGDYTVIERKSAGEQHLFENHSQDTRYRGPLDVSPIVSATFGMGGNNQPFVVESQPTVYDGANVTSPVNASNPQPGDPCHTLSTDSRNYLVAPVYCLQGNGIDRADTTGCNGKGVTEDVSYTLNTIDRPAVAYGIDQGASRDVGDLFLEEQSKTLTNGSCPGHHNGVVVAYGADVGFFNSLENQSPTLLARGYKDPHLISYSGNDVNYIVRRLTPTECARLQGFADWHGHLAQKPDLTDEEYSFWMEVRNTHAAINGKAVKDYTREQMLTWYNKLWTDAAEYKMWGNGIALPPALYCMQGIVDAMNKENDDSWML